MPYSSIASRSTSTSVEPSRSLRRRMPQSDGGDPAVESRVSSVLRRWGAPGRRGLEPDGGVREAESGGSSREQSPELGEGERERVRRVLRGWLDVRGPVVQANAGPVRSEWLGEIERERVRLVREWAHTASQRRVVAGGGEEAARDAERSGGEGPAGDREDGPGELVRLSGRRAQLELILRMVQERGRELQGVAEQRVVTNFAHGERIQSFLRSRFLLSGELVQEERWPSVDSSEPEHSQVSEIREEFHLRVESSIAGQVSSLATSTHAETHSNSGNSESHSNIAVDLANESQEESLFRDGEVDSVSQADMEEPIGRTLAWQDSGGQGQWEGENRTSEQQEESEIGFDEWPEGADEGSDGNWQENADQGWHREMEGGEDTEDWHEDRSNTTAESWPEESSNLAATGQRSLLRRPFRFSVLDDDSVYSTELRELVGRRSVSNLLQSEFRDSLDQLIQSYVRSQRQGHSSGEWTIQTHSQNPASSEEDQVGGNRFNVNQRNSVNEVPHIFRAPAPPPRIWQPELQNWRRYNGHRSMIDGDVINDLRAEMTRLQQGMSHMQRMLETCMDMQLELQRSIGEEISSALGRSVGRRADVKICDDGSNWTHVRKGTCCICCDSHIDSLLYRCGHMCSCWRCATELIQSDGKCPLCRAPIIDVIRAYSVT